MVCVYFLKQKHVHNKDLLSIKAELVIKHYLYTNHDKENHLL